ncbi:MAG: sulfite exporter TauE/SafE family protein [Myxococcota bacterium]
MEDLLAPLVLFVAALAQGFLGFGFGIIAMSGLSLLLDPWQAAGIVNLTGLLQTGGLALWLRRKIAWDPLRRILPGAGVGIGVGLALLGQLPGPHLLRLLGVVIVGFALWHLGTRRPRGMPSPRWDLPVGFASGVLTGMFNTGGPPIVAHVYRRPDPPETLIATVQAIFVCSALIRLLVASSLGMLSGAAWRQALAWAVFVLVGVWGGRRLGRRLSAARFRRTSWIALAGIGLWLIARH